MGGDWFPDTKARSVLSWGDYLAVGIETLRTGGWRELLKVDLGRVPNQAPARGGADRAKTVPRPLRRERDALLLARVAKTRELERFHASEGALKELEGASAAIAA